MGGVEGEAGGAGTRIPRILLRVGKVEKDSQLPHDGPEQVDFRGKAHLR